jgi:transcription elongation factor Elf1
VARFFEVRTLGIYLEFGTWDLEFPLPRRHTECFVYSLVETAKHSMHKVAADPDIFFHCQHCKAALVANRSAAGMTLVCQKCGQQTLVPKPEEPAATSLAYADELRGKLKENESQRAEVASYINQLTIQLHRWQLRLQTLNERKAHLEKELGSK